jgi:hypothetical protein
VKKKRYGKFWKVMEQESCGMLWNRKVMEVMKSFGIGKLWKVMNSYGKLWNRKVMEIYGIVKSNGIIWNSVNNMEFQM